MMPSLYCKDHKFENRRLISDVDISETVALLKLKMSSQIGYCTDKQELIYHGVLLKDKCTLGSYGINEGSTLHILSKQNKSYQETNDGQIDISKIAITLQSTLANPIYRMSICKTLEEADVIRSLVSKTEGLQQDIIAMGFIQSPSLLISLASSDKLQQTLRDHLCLANAIQYLISIVTPGGTLRHPNIQGPARREAAEIQQDLMQMDPRLVAHAEMLAAQEEAVRLRQSGQGVSSSSRNSTSQNTALGHGSSTSTASSNTAPGPSTGQASQQQIITSGLFRQAMAMAMSSTQQSDQTQQSTEMPRYESAIQQIRLMGIQASDQVIRQALMVSDGNVEAALNLLFESELNN